MYSKGFVNNTLVFDKKLTFIDCVSQFSTGGQDDYAYASWHTQSTSWLDCNVTDTC